MLKKFSLIAAALAVTACLGASSASAATLYTSAAHTTPVTVGTVFTATTPTGIAWNQYNGAELWQRCAKGSLSFKVTQNSGGVFKAQASAGSFEGCEPWGPQTVSTLPALEVGGSSVTVGTNVDWLSSKLEHMSWKWSGTTTWFANFPGATGNPPTKGVFAQQPAGAKIPVSIVLDKAGPAENTEHILTNETVSVTYTFTGTAASWSFG